VSCGQDEECDIIDSKATCVCRPGYVRNASNICVGERAYFNDAYCCCHREGRRGGGGVFCGGGVGFIDCHSNFVCVLMTGMACGVVFLIE